MNCANCERPIYWAHDIGYWCHFDGPTPCGVRGYGYNAFAEPKIDEPEYELIKPKEVILHCNNCEYSKHKIIPSGWVHGKDGWSNWYCTNNCYLYIGEHPEGMLITPPIWCPLKAKEPAKTYPIELKRRSVHDIIEYFVNLYSGEELKVEEFRKSLVELLTTYIEIRLQGITKKG